MATKYGKNIYRVKEEHVNAVYITGGTVLTSGDINKSFQAEFRHDLSGCGNPDSGIFIELKDFIEWQNITVEFNLLGTASCWGFNDSGGYGKAVGNNGTGNLLPFDSSKDSFNYSLYAFENPQFAIKTRACDNNTDNFMRYNNSAVRKFLMNRRRNMNGLLAGPQHGRSCNMTGSGAITIIKNIFVW